MTDDLTARRLLRSAFGSAAEALAAQLALGKLLWAVDGVCGYHGVREDGEHVLTVTTPEGGRLDQVLPGVDLDLL